MSVSYDVQFDVMYAYASRRHIDTHVLAHTAAPPIHPCFD